MDVPGIEDGESPVVRTVIEEFLSELKQNEHICADAFERLENLLSANPAPTRSELASALFSDIALEDSDDQD